MPAEPGTHTLGPGNATLTVRTGKSGAASKAGHNLLIEVTSWRGTLELAPNAADSSVSLSADAGSLAIREGTGGIQPLGDDDKAGIKETIDKNVLKRTSIEFRSRRVIPNGDRLTVEGDLELVGTTRPIMFDLAVGDDQRISGQATVKQTDFGIKPYSALFGTLKVADAVEVAIDGSLARS